MGEYIAGCLVGLLAGSVLVMATCGNIVADDAERRGRCIELCRPEKLIELVNDDKECLCATKRVRLTP